MSIVNTIRQKTNEALKKTIYKRREAYKSLLETSEGKVILADLYKYCGVGRHSFTNDSHRTAYNLGLKSVAEHIKAILNQSDEDIKKFLAQSEDKSRDSFESFMENPLKSITQNRN